MSAKYAFRLSLWLLCCAAVLPARLAGAAWSTERLAEMEVHLFVPSGSGARALLIALHGCTQSPDALRDRGRFEGAAERYGAVVALPAVPNGGVIAGCWDYYGSDHALDDRHNRNLIALADALVADGALSIDPDRVYLIGLSSGGGQTAVTGCLAPDRFAGIGINAGPAAGTSLSEVVVVSTDRDRVAGVCRTLAGPRSAGFDSQLTSVIHGSGDFVVARAYARINAEAMAEVYRGGGAPLVESVLDVASLPGSSPSGEGALWSDGFGPRVSMIVVEGMGHAFPAGEGDGLETSFVAQHGVAWPEYLLGFFEANNRRLQRPPPADGGVVPPGMDASADRDAGATDAADPADPGPTDQGCSCGAARARRGGSGGPLFSILVCAFLVRTRRRLVEYERFGGGRTPVLLIHGNFASAKWWRALGRLLPGRFIAYAPNLPGFAGSPLGFERITMGVLADDVIAFADAVELQRFHLLGHSLGTAVAMELAARAPDRVASLVLLSPVPVDGMSVVIEANAKMRAFDPRRAFAGSRLQLLHAIAQWCGLHRPALERTLIRMVPSLASDPELPILVDDAAAMSPRAVVEIYEALARFDPRAALPSLSVPTLVMAGQEDPLIPPGLARDLAEELPCATFQAVEGVAHGLPLEAPAELAKSLSRFVRFGRWWLAWRRWLCSAI